MEDIIAKKESLSIGLGYAKGPFNGINLMKEIKMTEIITSNIARGMGIYLHFMPYPSIFWLGFLCLNQRGATQVGGSLNLERACYTLFLARSCERLGSEAGQHAEALGVLDKNWN